MDQTLKKIEASVKNLLKELPPEVTLVAAAKTRTLEEVEAAIRGGIRHVGYNYVQEGLPIIEAVGDRVKWHMIGHLQRNKAKFVAEHFDVCETVDSLRLAKYLDQRCAMVGRELPVLIEINSGEETNKNGVLPENLVELIEKISQLKNIKVQGLMTMGPRFGNPEQSRPYFQLTRKAFESIKAQKFPNVDMRYLSMGMSNTYKIAIEEGSNIIRIGTQLFGERE